MTFFSCFSWNKKITNLTHYESDAAEICTTCVAIIYVDVWKQSHTISFIQEAEVVYVPQAGETEPEMFYFNLKPVQNSHGQAIYEAMEQDSMDGEDR